LPARASARPRLSGRIGRLLFACLAALGAATAREHDVRALGAVGDGRALDTAAIQRNLAFGRKHKITGTPTLIFANGSRVPGAIGAQDVEKRLAAAGK
jgi:protein-disulfide isomerase